MADLWGNIKKILGRVAPLVGNAILPGVGGLAGSLVASVLGVDNEAEAIEAALLTATPEQITKLKELQFKHEEKLIELGMRQDEIYIRDIQDARLREREIVKATGQKDINLYVLAWSIVIGFFVLCGVLMTYKMPEGQNEVIFMLFGGLVSGFSTVLAYFFGSSKGSSDKTKLMAGSKRGDT